MAPRANWKGFLKVAEVSCAVGLYAVTSSAERIVFHTINRATGNRVHRQFVDGDTGKPVEHDAQIKGYEVGPDEYIMLDSAEVAAAVPASGKTLIISSFIDCGDIDDVYFDRPYYLAPSGRHAEEAYGLIRDGMRAERVAALARTVLFHRVRTVLIRAHGVGLIATTLNFDYEIASAQKAFANIPKRTLKGEMLQLAEHIIKTKRGKFDPSAFDDRYEAALAELVKAKLEGRRIELRKAPKPEKVVDLLAALRESAALGKNRMGSRAAARPGTAPSRRKAS